MTLGVIVFVTILLFGIFFSEIGFLTQKVQEAENFAVWDATGRRMHDIEGGDWQVYRKQKKSGAIPFAEAEAQQRYGDFDGRTGQNRSGQTFMAITRATRIDVECDSNLGAEKVLGTDPRDADSAGEKELLSAMPSATGRAGIRCRASSRMFGAQMPSAFLDKGSFFKTKHWKGTPIPICGIGRAKGGDCAGRLTVLLDDWGLQTRADSRECHLNIDSSSPTCGNVGGNQSYYNWANRIYTKFGGTGGAGSALVGSVKGSSPNETQFFMSFRGKESKFTENVGSNESGQSKWETTPFRADNVYQRSLRAKDQWLGRSTSRGRARARGVGAAHERARVRRAAGVAGSQGPRRGHRPRRHLRRAESR